MELRSRSRSKTPFQTQSFLEAESFEGSNNHLTVTRSTRKTTTVRTMTRGESLSQHQISAVTKPATNKTKNARTTRSAIKTSDYSSEEGEIESMTHISENEKSKIIEDAKAAANGSAEISALNLYRKAGRYWDKYPKTDYTYSRHSRDRVEIAPGVVQMPNMSRRTIHSHDSSTNTESYFDRFTSGSQYVKKRLFSSENNNEDYEDESYKISRVSRRRTVTSIIKSTFTSVFLVIFWCFYSLYKSVNSTTIWMSKKLHHLASRLMLWDTWLLKKEGAERSRAVVALCLLPLLFLAALAAWWLLWGLGSAAYGAYFTPSTTPLVQAPPIDDHIEVKNVPLPPQLPPTPLPSNLETRVDTDDIVEKVLQNPKIYNIINYHQNYKSEERDSARDEQLINIINELKEEIKKVKDELVLLEQTKNADLNKIAYQFRSEYVRNIALLTQKLNHCCNSKSMINLEPHIRAVLKSLFNDPEFLSSQKGLTDWLQTLFVAKQDLEMRLSNLTRQLTKDYDESVENTAKQVMKRVVAKLVDRDFSLTEEQIKKVVKSALAIYDADKTGLVDFAMEPMGGQIVTTRCTESYHTGTAVISVLGVPLWYPSNSPRIVITPGINPGECWAFQNFPGFIVIKLANRIRVDAFSMEHVSRLLVPEGKIDSAPKEFEVYGLDDENEKEPVKIGEYVYEYDGDSLQYFAAQNYGLVFTMIEVRIKSNHGNPNYTCLYRFRVHGTVANEPT